MRIREALKVAAPVPGQGHSAFGTGPATNHGARQWLPHVGDSFQERLALFEKNAAELKASFWLVHRHEEFAKRLVDLKEAEGWKKVGSHTGELTDQACRILELPVVSTDQPYQVRELENCDVGITQCDALIAQTGSVLVSNRSAGGRALSVLPPHHLVLARREQLIPDLPEAFALLKQRYSTDYPTFMSLITGPSRTGDIERILVLGAHGPKRLTIVCV
jgi:L-lactate dehydrogenase complex protein LldG